MPAKGALPGKAAASRKLTCPACGTVGSFRPGAALRCKVCGTAIPDPDGPAAAPALPPPVPPMQAVITVPAPAGEPPTALAIVSLVAGIVALATLWVFPVCILAALTALVCGIIALSSGARDGGAQAMAGVGVALAVLALLLTWWAFAVFADNDGGSSVYIDNGGGSGDSSSDDGGSGGSSGGGGGSGGDSGGSGGGGDTDVSAPAPVAALLGLGLLGAAAWRRR